MFSMEKVIKPERNIYCPITISDIATNNANVRQNSLREYSHAQNAAYRAFCRGPGRPQTAAFGRVYFETRLNRRSLSPSKANLRDCVIASKAMVEERSDATVKDSCRISQQVYTERRLLSRSKTARRTLRRHPDEEEAVQISGSERSLEDTISVKNKEETNDFLIELDSGSEEKRYDIESNEEINVTPDEDTISDSINRQLIVYHFVDNGCCCTAAVSYLADPSVGCKACTCDQQILVSSYNVEMQGEGYQSTPGLVSCDSQENKALRELLQKQLSLSIRQHNNDDKSQYQHLESLSVLISQLINVKPPTGYFYYFAYGPVINTRRFMTYINHKLEDTAWGLLYGFKLTSPDTQDYRWGSIWPKCKYSPQSAVEGRIYIISRQEADVLDKQLHVRQGLLTVLLPVWLMDSDQDACSTAQYCLPALVPVLPHELVN